MIRCVDSHEWGYVSYILRYAWMPLVDSPDHYDTIKAIFGSNGRVRGGPTFEVCGATAENGESNNHIWDMPTIDLNDIPVTYAYRVEHEVIMDGGMRGVREILYQLWGTVSAVIHKDARGSEALSFEIDNITKKVDSDDSCA